MLYVPSKALKSCLKCTSTNSSVSEYWYSIHALVKLYPMTRVLYVYQDLTQGGTMFSCELVVMSTKGNN